VPVTLTTHQRCHVLHERCGAEEVRLKALAHAVKIDLFDTADEAVAGVVDQHVETPIVADDRVPDGSHALTVTQIEVVNYEPLVEIAAKIVVVRVVPDGGMHCVTAKRKRASRRETDALRRRAASDHDDPA